MSARQPDLFFGDKRPPRCLPPERAYRRAERTVTKPYAWETMGTWVRYMHRLFAIEQPSSEFYRRVAGTARELTVSQIRECRHDDDLARCETMLVDARGGWLSGLDRVFSWRERGELLVEVRNRRRLLAMGRLTPKAKGPRLDPTLLPTEALERLIQTHPDAALVDRLRVERHQHFLYR
ncbi:hypothetical protein [Sphingomonas sp. VNH70]|uniref:hypothetical protein n=1 Tax=Sphingomonas silueang TaxID=3156617 RepID=UPI0032B50F06